MNVLILVVLAAVVAAAVVLLVRRAHSGSSCCGTHEKAEKRVRASGERTGETREVILEIGGMTCDNCARKVQNALHALPGVSAKVSIATKTAKVTCGTNISDAELRETVRKAGYVVIAK